jgi:arylsulfatase A-like enzyme
VEHEPYGYLKYHLITKDGEGSWREWLQAYLACVAFVDAQIGRVLDALKQSPYADNTIVVVTSDNGYHIGEKEFIFKNTLWDAGAEIPIIASGPGITHGVCERPVSLIDLYPTFTDLCGLPGDPHERTHGLPLDGRSLKPLLERPGGGWDGPDCALSSVRGFTGVHHTARTRNHRYILCSNGEEELYDHRNDPHEWHNLAAMGKQEDVREELREQLIETVYTE